MLQLPLGRLSRPAAAAAAASARLARPGCRYSSSESSRPSDGSAKGASASRSTPSGNGRKKLSGSTATTTTTTSTAAAAAAAAAADRDAFSHLPRVAATAHLDINGVSLSSFYSLHRPIRVDDGLSADADAAVDAFFKDGQLKGPSKDPKQVLNVLGNIVKALGGTPGPVDPISEEDQVVQSLISTHVSSLHPFCAPKSPSPVKVDRSKLFHDLQSQGLQGQGAAKKGGEEDALSDEMDLSAFDLDEPARSMTATVFISDNQDPVKTVGYHVDIPADFSKRIDLGASATEKDADGAQQPFMRRLLARAIRTASGPSEMSFPSAVEAVSASAALSGATIASALRHPLWRSRARQQQAQRTQMRLISVKRRRRLKIKKHKYKKLLKRTRNERRRLDRL